MIPKPSTSAADPTGEVFSSDWNGLSEHLLATIYAVDSNGARIGDGFTVKCPFTRADMEIAANWQSPFENTGPMSALPTLSGMLQSGAYAEPLAQMVGNGADPNTKFGAFRIQLAQELREGGRQLQGRTGMTKLNSTQVFTGAPPVKIQATAVFKAFADPAVEVHAPIEQLVRWSLPRRLAPAGGLLSIMQGMEGRSALDVLFPSEAPAMVALAYGGWNFAPMVIESVSMPLYVPRSKHGEMVEASMDLTFATLTAFDAQDWKNAIELKGPGRSNGRG